MNDIDYSRYPDFPAEGRPAPVGFADREAAKAHAAARREFIARFNSLREEEACGQGGWRGLLARSGRGLARLLDAIWPPRPAANTGPGEGPGGRPHGQSPDRRLPERLS